MRAFLFQVRSMPSNRPNISVIILNWNNAPDTLECLATVYASENASFDVYVADNGSTDGSLEIIRSAYPQAIYIENNANLGFAEGNNRAITAALDGGAEYLFLLNNDAVLREDTLFLLKRAADAHPTSAVFGPKIYYYDAPATIWYGGGEWDPARASFYHRDWNTDEEEAPRNNIEKTSYVCGCAFFIRADAVRHCGLMDNRFFLNWEEIDWCWRLKKAGYDCLYVPEAKCWHKISRSFIGGKRGPMWLYFYWRNRLLWMELHLPFKEFVYLGRKILWPQIVDLLKDSFRNKEARASLRGICDYFLRRFGPCPQYLLKKKRYTARG
jgi:hypothetical protein